MEENKEEVQTSSVQEASEPQESSSGVSFPTVGQPKSSGNGKTWLVLGILVLLGALGYFIFKGSTTNVPEATSTPTISPTEVPTSTPSPKAIDKSKVKIEVQNGTGITGEAAFLQTQLKSMGYTSVTVGNATSQNNTVTTVTFAKSLGSDVVDELTKKLKELYKEVEVKTATTTTVDVLVVTGLKKGATAKPSASATPKASASPTATGSATPSGTSTPTTTP